MLEVIGYENERRRLDIALSKGIKFVLIEGELGTGKTTLILDAMRKHSGIRIVGGKQSEFADIIERELRKPNIVTALSNRIKGLNGINPLIFLEKYRGRPVVLYFDEAHYFDEIALTVKNAVTDNPQLQAVIALTPKQREKLFANFSEVGYRFNQESIITLQGLAPQNKRAFIEEYKTAPFSEEAFSFVAENASTPQQIIDLIKGLEVKAAENNEKEVTQETVRLLTAERIKPEAVQAQATKPLQRAPQQERILDAIGNAPNGLTPKEISDATQISQNALYVRLVELKKQELVKRVGTKYFIYRSRNEAGLGA